MVSTILLGLLILAAASAAIPFVGRTVIGLIRIGWRGIVGVARQLPAPLAVIARFLLGLLQILIGLAVAYLIGYLIGGILVLVGFAASEPWAVWAGFMIWAMLLLIAGLLWNGPRSLSATFLFLALLCLGTPFTGISARASMMLVTLALLWAVSSRGVETWRRALMLFIGAVVIAYSIGSSLLPAPIMDAVRNGGSVGTYEIADAIDPDTPPALITAERTARDQALAKELVNYQRLVASLDAVRSTRSLTKAEWAMYQQARADVVRINQEMSANHGEQSIASRVDGIVLIRALIVITITLVVLFIFVLWSLFQKNNGPGQARTVEAPAAAVHQSEHGGVALSAMQLIAMLFIAAFLLVVLIQAPVWFASSSQSVSASTPITPPLQDLSSQDIAGDLTKRMMVYEVKEDWPLTDRQGKVVQDVTTGTPFAYDGEGQPPDPALLGPYYAIPVALLIRGKDSVQVVRGVMPAIKLKKYVESSPAPSIAAAAGLPAAAPSSVTFYLRNVWTQPFELWWRPLGSTEGDKPWAARVLNNELQVGWTRQQQTGSASPGLWVVKDLAGNDLRVFPPPTTEGDPANPMLYP